MQQQLVLYCFDHDFQVKLLMGKWLSDNPDHCDTEMDAAMARVKRIVSKLSRSGTVVLKPGMDNQQLLSVFRKSIRLPDTIHLSFRLWMHHLDRYQQLPLIDKHAAATLYNEYRGLLLCIKQDGYKEALLKTVGEQR